MMDPKWLNGLEDSVKLKQFTINYLYLMHLLLTVSIILVPRYVFFSDSAILCPKFHFYRISTVYLKNITEENQ